MQWVQDAKGWQDGKGWNGCKMPRVAMIAMVGRVAYSRSIDSRLQANRPIGIGQ